MDRGMLIFLLALMTGVIVMGGVLASSASPSATFSGTITKVDSANKEIIVQNSSGEMTFRWTDETQVVGFPVEKVGLASKALKEGMKVTVLYTEGDQSRVVKRIDVKASNLNTLKGMSMPFECGVEVC